MKVRENNVASINQVGGNTAKDSSLESFVGYVREVRDEFSDMTLESALNSCTDEDRKRLVRSFFNGEQEQEKDESESEKVFMSAEEVEDLIYEMNEVAGQYGYDASEFVELDTKDAPHFDAQYEEWIEDSGLAERMESLPDDEKDDFVEFLEDSHLSLEFFQEAAEATYWITLEERRVDEDYEEEEEENEEKEDTYE